MGRGRWGLGGGGGTKGAHLKSMGSYEKHAWGDAMAIASLLDEFVGAAKARVLYERMDANEVWKYEEAMEDAIADFIGRIESQRPVIVRKLPDDATRVCFLTLAILGCIRARDLMELRDRYRELLAPGRGNRETVRGLYTFSNQVQGLVTYEWPDEVFSSMGLDDSDDYDDLNEGSVVDVSAPVDATPLKPTIPPPPPPVKLADSTEVLVTIGKSDTVAARSGVEGGAWKLQLVDAHHETVLLTLLPKELRRGVLVAHLAKLGEMAWGQLPTLLLLSDSQRALVEEVNAVAGHEIAAVMRKGAMSLGCMKWAEEFLRAAKRELGLIGEPMVTADELVDCNAHVLSTLHADPSRDWQAQRDDIEKWVKTILVHRGRWLGEVKVDKSGLRSLRSGDRDLAKAKRTVTKLANASRTVYGDALYEITRTMLAWRSGEMSTEDAKLAAARAYVEYRFRAVADRNQFQLGFELDETFGAGSAEKDLLEAGVLQLLGGPFEAGRPAPPEPTPYGATPFANHPARPRGWFLAWWCVLEVANPADFGDARTWMPSDKALSDAVSIQVSGQVTLRVSGSPVPLERMARNGGQTWVDADVTACQGHGGQLIEWLNRGGSYSPYDRPNASEDCTRYGLLVVANGPTRDAVIEAHKVWPRAAGELAGRICTQDLRGKRARPPQSLRVVQTTQGYFDSLIGTVERLALMAGRKWDASARRVVSGTSGSADIDNVDPSVSP